MAEVQKREEVPFEEVMEGVYMGISPEKKEKREFMALPEDITEEEINYVGPLVFGQHPVGAQLVDYSEKVERINGKPYFRFTPGNNLLLLKEKCKETEEAIEAHRKKQAAESTREDIDQIGAGLS